MGRGPAVSYRHSKGCYARCLLSVPEVDLSDWLVGWLINWLVGRLVGWLDGWLIIDCLIDWFIDWLVRCSIEKGFLSEKDLGPTTNKQKQPNKHLARNEITIIIWTFTCWKKVFKDFFGLVSCVRVHNLIPSFLLSHGRNRLLHQHKRKISSCGKSEDSTSPSRTFYDFIHSTCKITPTGSHRFISGAFLFLSSAEKCVAKPTFWSIKPGMYDLPDIRPTNQRMIPQTIFKKNWRFPKIWIL